MKFSEIVQIINKIRLVISIMAPKLHI